MNLAKVTYV
ncbi:hypothetical protein YPPY103_0812, partial [Yersinia pestis PY-103]